MFGQKRYSKCLLFKPLCLFGHSCDLDNRQGGAVWAANEEAVERFTELSECRTYEGEDCKELRLRRIRAKAVRFPISFQIHVSCPRPGHSKSARKRLRKLWRSWMAVMMTTLMKWCYFYQPWLFSRGKCSTTWTCRSRWQSWPDRRGRWVRWWPTRCSSPPRSPRTCRSWKRSMIGQILRMWKLGFTLTAIGNNSV